jgi:hypothetical protein
MQRQVISPQDVQRSPERFRGGESVLPPDVTPVPPSGGTTSGSSDDYMTRLIKFVPTEVVTFYAGAQATLPGIFQALDAKTTALWVLFLAGLIGTPLYLWRVQGVKKILQLGISTGAYVVWAFALGEPLTSALGVPAQSADQTGWAFLIVAVYTFFAALVKP